MGTGDKWNNLKEYLEGKNDQIMSGIRSAAREDNIHPMTRLSAQMVLLDDILAEVERLDRGVSTISLQKVATPPVYKF